MGPALNRLPGVAIEKGQFDGGSLTAVQVDWLHQLVGDWQLVSDLSFADLVLATPTPEGDWKVVAHVRPNTGQLVFYDDIVGRVLEHRNFPYLTEAYRTRRHLSADTPVRRGEVEVYEDVIPVVHRGTPIAVLTRHAPVSTRRGASRLEDTYRALADMLLAMIAGGHFPHPSAQAGARRGAPRVGDGVVHLDVDGNVLYASPNAISALHRLGFHDDIAGRRLSRVVDDLVRWSGNPVDEALAVVLSGRAPWRSEVTASGAVVSARSVPLTVDGSRTGAIVLIRDITELRRRERELITKDATIREIHHRVKNNLQTVAALLRLQARRIQGPEGKAALEEAGRRVGTIALVHETLSRSTEDVVNFDDVAFHLVRAVVEVASAGHRIDSLVTGGFGLLRAEDATALAMILSELIQNAAEHGLPDRDGRIVIDARRTQRPGGEQLTVRICDDGVGLPVGFEAGASGLGTQIVDSLVSDLQGVIEWGPAQPRGTKVLFTARLRPLGVDGS